MRVDPAATAALVWFRRDLRADDHAALYHALRGHGRVFCAFVFDTEILDSLPRRDRRVDFIRRSLAALDTKLAAAGGGLIVRHGRARDEIPRLARELGVAVVYTNHDYEPQAIDRDEAVERALGAAGIPFETHKDQAIFERGELLTRAGRPFTVFTPYKNAWLRALDPFYSKSYPCARYYARLARPAETLGVPSLADIGFESTDIEALGFQAGEDGAQAAFDAFRERIDEYATARDYPAVRGTSRLSVHLRFGTISVRTLARAAHAHAGEGAAVWLSELAWRDFYFQILAHFPHVAERAFNPAYDAVKFDDDPALLEAWREGRTGYPIVDAAMRQLARTGFMHNRLRMITASFLTKDLHVHWSHGERHFAVLLNDFDLSANNGGWQWAASSGTDAQPYFRIFNPVSQSERFDPEGAFIRRYCPELAKVPVEFIHAPWTMSPRDQEAAGCRIGRDYAAPVVDHAVERKVALERYAVVKRTALSSPPSAPAVPRRTSRRG